MKSDKEIRAEIEKLEEHKQDLEVLGMRQALLWVVAENVMAPNDYILLDKRRQQ